MISRRELFRTLLGRAAPSPEVAPAPTPARSVFPIHRPPGAVAEKDFLDRCTRCGDCVKACPHQAIVPAPARLRGAEGTPMIVASDSPCRQCSDTPCAAVCQPAVLRADNPQKMGTARVERMECLAWQRSFCTVCSEHCPVPGAIRLEDGKPSIDPSACTGCGICLYACPAPRKAILLTAEMNRPAWKAVKRD